MSAQDPSLNFVSGTATSAKFRFVNSNTTLAKTFFLEYTTAVGANASIRVPLNASDASGDIIVNNLDYTKVYLFELTQTGKDNTGVYIKRSSVFSYSPAGPPGAPVISDLIRNVDGGCELFVTPGAANGGTGIKYAFHSQNIKNRDIPPIKHWSLYDASSNNVIVLANGNLNFAFNDLSNGDVYEFWVNTINSNGECSDDSNTVVVTPTNCPGAVRELGQVSGDASAKISWKKPEDETSRATTSATAIVSYTIVINNNVTKVDVSKQTFALDASGNYGDLSWNKTDLSNNADTIYDYVVKGLSNFTDYTITVYASSVKGAGLERSIQVLPFSSDLDVNGSVKAYPSNGVIDISWNAPSSTFFEVKQYNTDIYSVSDVVTSKGVTKKLTLIPAVGADVTKSHVVLYDASSNGAINGYTTRFSGLTNGTLYKIVITVVLKNGTNDIVCTVDKDLTGVFSLPFTTASAITGYNYNSYSTLAILDWHDVSGSATGGYPVVRYDVSYVDLSNIVQTLSTRESTITITGLKNDISYGVFITPITGPVSTFNGTNVVKSTLVTGSSSTGAVFRAVSSNSENVVVNTVNNLAYKYVDSSSVTLSWKQPAVAVTGGSNGSSSKVLSYAIFQTNSEGFKNGAALTSVNFDPSWNSLTDISTNVTVPSLSSAYLGVITTVKYSYVSTTGDASFNVSSNIQYIPYSTGNVPSISLSGTDISNVLIPKSATNPTAYTQGTITVNITNNNAVPSSVICFAPDIKGSSITGAIKTASNLPTADSIIVTSANGLTSQVVFVYNYAVSVVVVTASNVYGSNYGSATKTI